MLPVVADELLGQPTDLSEADLYELPAGKFALFAQRYGYELDSSISCDRTILFVDGNKADPPLGQLSGQEDLIEALGLPIVSSTTFPTVVMTLSQGSWSLQVDHASVGSRLGRAWVKNIIEGMDMMAAATSWSLYAGGPGFLIDTGTEVVGGTWSDGYPVSDGSVAIEERLRAHVNHARDIGAEIASNIGG